MSLLSIEQIKLARDECDLCMQKTQLGWVVVGGFKSCNLIDLNKQLARFWEVEECVDRVPRSLEDSYCEAHYKEHTKRDSHGRYVVRLPVKAKDVDLGNSKQQALRRFNSLQRKLRYNLLLGEEYAKVFRDYVDKGYASRVDQEPAEGYFLPHHAVLKPTSTTTKVRIVFDASAKTDKGHSLNQMLFTGPSLQPKLFTHLLYIRTPRFVVMADIEQMYRQILIDPRDRRYQLVLWENHGETEIFELNTVTFGISAAPFLAIRALQQLAEDEKDLFPLASAAVTENFYVVDFFFFFTARTVWTK